MITCACAQVRPAHSSRTAAIRDLHSTLKGERFNLDVQKQQLLQQRAAQRAAIALRKKIRQQEQKQKAALKARQQAQAERARREKERLEAQERAIKQRQAESQKQFESVYEFTPFDPNQLSNTQKITQKNTPVVTQPEQQSKSTQSTTKKQPNSETQTKKTTVNVAECASTQEQINKHITNSTDTNIRNSSEQSIIPDTNDTTEVDFTGMPYIPFGDNVELVGSPAGELLSTEQYQAALDLYDVLEQRWIPPAGCDDEYVEIGITIHYDGTAKLEILKESAIPALNYAAKKLLSTTIPQDILINTRGLKLQFKLKS